MKKLLLTVLCIFVLCGRVWALPDNCISQEYTSDTQVKSSSGYVYNATITFVGGTAGDEAWLWDSTSAQAYGSSTARCHVVAGAANAVATCGPYTTSNYFTTAIYAGYRSTGKVTIDIQWQ